MNADIINEHFNILIKSMEKLFDETSLRFDIVNKLKNEFSQLTNEIKPQLSTPNGISSVPFERNMSQLSSLCQRIFFASNNSSKEPETICQFFSDLHYPIDLNDQYFDDELQDDDDQIIYLDFEHKEIFSK